MRGAIILLLFAFSLNLAAAFANLAALLQSSGSAAGADVVGFGGIAIAVVAFIGSSVFVWRNV